MINPERRSLLTDALTPPDRYRFDCGVATTYSLDLVTLLTLPLHLARRDAEHTSPERPDPLPVLDAVRRMGDRLTVFCQRGRLHIPRKSNSLLGLLENMVQETQVPHEHGVFHPKVWLLRFEPVEAADQEPTLLRLLVLTRNLTDDRSWDLSLWLEGEPGKKRVDASRPLASFIEWLLRGNEATVGAARTEQIEQLCADAVRTTWTPPGQFEEVRFYPLGIGKKTASWFPEAPNGVKWDELGVISPFVSMDALTRLASRTRAPLFLVSRAEELDKCASHGGFTNVRVLSDQALSGDTEDDVAHRQCGLHAKAYIGKRAWNTHLFVGSANATGAALVQGRNVEFVVELIGRASKVGGPAAWVGEEGLGPLLADYVRSEPKDADALEDEHALEALRDALARGPLALHGELAESGWTVDLRGLDNTDWNGASAHAWLVSQDETRAKPIDAARQALVNVSLSGIRLGEFAPHQVTAFTGFTLMLGKATLSFVLKLPLHGGPEERDLEILHAAIRNREGLIRYLLLLLGDWDGDEGDGNGDGVKFGDGHGASFDDMPLFEMLARAYAREPERLAQVRDLVERLRRKSAQEQEHGSEQAHTSDPVLTADFLEIWSVFETALKNEKLT
ncbi:phospholipase D family protein [Burkholderia vietnamiensis]|uniref:phospholipase D family protein n=1 Tax=Burkholderia vietnamiensis TaxID=60552 RepID=UPI001CF184E8|nr:phospholipase D family protein [Burkholderia vietnamiensis]MCA7986608.1 phospholipase D family protein [Burkholderia vietnamiensis]HDR8931518.1 phospholipase D family protein [Burkholderia vietnamiensis]